MNTLSWIVPVMEKNLAPIWREANTSPAALTIPRRVGSTPARIAWITTCPPVIVISIELMAQQVTVALPRAIVAVPTYLPSKAVVVGAGACAATGVANVHAVIVKSILARPNMLLSPFRSRG